MSSNLERPKKVDNDNVDIVLTDEKDYIAYLEIQLKRLEEEKKKLERKLEYYKSEIEKLLSPPLIEATVESVLPDGRVIVKSSSGPNLVVYVADFIDKSRLKPGTRVALNQRGSTIVDVLPDYYDTYVQLMEVIEKPNVKYSDIGGLDEQIKELREVVELPLKHPELFEELGIDVPKGVLLHGPPGCGKTLLAKAVAAEAGATFIAIVGSELVNKYIGEGARIVRELFALARKKAPAIVFIDEIDAIAARRLELGTSGEREVQRTLMQLLAEIDGFRPLDRVKVLAATNRIDILDPAILRSGRFDRIIEVPLPDKSGRVQIFKIHTRRVKLGGDIDYDYLAEITANFSGADIRLAVIEAGYIAIRENRRCITMSDLIEGIERVKSRKNIKQGWNWQVSIENKANKYYIT